MLASAVLACYVTKVDPAIVDTVAFEYILSRLFYTYIYVTGNKRRIFIELMIELGDTTTKSWIRTVTWFGGFAGLSYLFTQAIGNL